MICKFEVAEKGEYDILRKTRDDEANHISKKFQFTT